MQRQGEWSDAWGGSATHLAERSGWYERSTVRDLREAVGNPGWGVELGVIENIKELGPELQVQPFGQHGVLEDGKVPVVDARPMKETPIGSALHSQPCLAKGCGVKIV